MIFLFSKVKETCYAFLLLAFSVVTQASPVENVGIVAGMQTNVIRAGIQLEVKTPIYFGNLVKTNDTGLSQFLFNNQNTAKLGHNSEMEIRKDIVGPLESKPGIGIRFIRGIIRYIGSFSSKTNPSIIETPHIIAGVQGGIVDLVVTDESTTVALRFGTLVCKAGQEVVTIRSSDFGCIKDKDNPLRAARLPEDFAGFLDSDEVVAGTGNTSRSVGAISAGRFIREPSTSECGSSQASNTKRCNVDKGLFPTTTNEKGPTAPITLLHDPYNS